MPGRQRRTAALPWRPDASAPASAPISAMTLVAIAGVIGWVQSQRSHSPPRELGAKRAVERSGRRGAAAATVHFCRRLLSRKRAAALDRERCGEVGADGRQLTGEWIGAEGIHHVVPRVAG